MKWLLLLAAIIAAVIWYYTRRGKQAAPLRQQKASAPKPASQVINLTVPMLPAGLETEITIALKDGMDPDEIELPSPYHAHHFGVAGESFENANGTSRQTIIEETMPGCTVYLVPEPDNEHDNEAVRLFVSKGGSSTAQIGYLPRGHGLLGEIGRGHVMAWFASRRRSDAGLWDAAIYLLRTEA
jgi:HIRAN domain